MVIYLGIDIDRYHLKALNLYVGMFVCMYACLLIEIRLNIQSLLEEEAPWGRGASSSK